MNLVQTKAALGSDSPQPGFPPLRSLLLLSASQNPHPRHGSSRPAALAAGAEWKGEAGSTSRLSCSSFPGTPGCSGPYQLHLAQLLIILITAATGAAGAARELQIAKLSLVEINPAVTAGIPGPEQLEARGELGFAGWHVQKPGKEPALILVFRLRPLISRLISVMALLDLLRCQALPALLGKQHSRWCQSSGNHGPEGTELLWSPPVPAGR